MLAKFTCIFLFSITTFSVLSHDIIKVNGGHSTKDARTKYTFLVLNSALEISSEKFGSYEVTNAGASIPNHRLLPELKSGKYINLAVALTTQEWEDEIIPIRIPIRRGAFNYRLLAINKNNSKIFNNINTVEQLKKLRVGLRKSWTTAKVLRSMDFNIVNAYSYEAVFGMLNKGRFDYLPGGIHQIFDEISDRVETLPNLTVEPNLAIYCPSPVYIFVSPANPELAERLTWGLEKMITNGDLKKLFDAHYLKNIKKADLPSRKIINVGNPLLPKETPLHRPELWHSFDLGNKKAH